MTILATIKSDLEFREGMIATITDVNRSSIRPLIVEGLEASAEMGECFELLEMRVGIDTVWWPEDQLCTPLHRRKGEPLTRIVAHQRTWPWMCDVSIVIRCMKGPKVLVVNIVGVVDPQDC